MANLNRMNFTDEKSFKNLKDLHAKYEKNLILKDLFDEDQHRFSKYCKSLKTLDGEILFDFSKNLLNEEIFQGLIELARERKVELHRDKMYNCEKINVTNNQSVLHVALRNRSNRPFLNKSGLNVMTDINKVLDKMKSFVNGVRTGDWRGYTGESIKNVVNIGVGGLVMGPLMVTEALKPYGSTGPLEIHFVSNVDGTTLTDTLSKLNPATTLFVIASKSFCTQETIMNAQSAKQWFLENTPNCCDSIDGYHHITNHHLSNHFVAVTANEEKAVDFGVSRQNVFKCWDWIVDRYSVWSAFGLGVALFVGFEHFEKFLEGAHFIDEHFRNTSLEENIPVIMAVIGIWYNNFYGAETHAIMPYDQYLQYFSNYFQQGDMESNGKSRRVKNGHQTNYSTGPIIWGDSGLNGPNSFYQLIHQGTHLIPCDFIAPIHSHNPLRGGVHHEILLASFLVQSEVLMNGIKYEDDMNESDIQAHKIFTGNRPSTSILLPRVTPFTLGALMAVYEHKIFVQGSIWDINSYDQWGIELGKKLGQKIEEELRSPHPATTHDPSTNNLINFIKENR